MGLFDKKWHIVFYTLSVIAVLFTVSVYGILCSDSTCVHLGCNGDYVDSEWVD